MSRDTEIQALLDGGTQIAWRIAEDRVRTRSAVVHALARLSDSQISGLFSAELPVEVFAPSEHQTYQVATRRFVLIGAERGQAVEGRAEQIYLGPVLERMDPTEVYVTVLRALTYTLELLSGRNDFEARRVADAIPGGGLRIN